MAFTSNMIASSGRTIENAYCKVVVHCADTSTITVIIKVWETSTERQEFPSSPLSEFESQHILNTASIENNNPVEYAYKLLEASEKFPEAIWNI